jgi:hypothetical protein
MKDSLEQNSCHYIPGKDIPGNNIYIHETNTLLGHEQRYFGNFVGHPQKE